MMRPIEKFPQCPRCLSSWSDYSNDCSANCGMILCGVGGPLMVKIPDLIKEGDRLYWTTYDNCMYFHIFNRTILPWLDFKIDTNKLKLYLTFS